MSGWPVAYGDSYSDTNSHIHAYADSYPYAYRNGSSNDYTSSHAYSYCDAYSYSCVYAHRNGYSYSHTDAYRDAYGYCVAEVPAHAQAASHAWAAALMGKDQFRGAHASSVLVAAFCGEELPI